METTKEIWERRSFLEQELQRAETAELRSELGHLCIDALEPEEGFANLRRAIELEPANARYRFALLALEHGRLSDAELQHAVGQIDLKGLEGHERVYIDCLKALRQDGPEEALREMSRELARPQEGSEFRRANIAGIFCQILNSYGHYEASLKLLDKVEDDTRYSFRLRLQCFVRLKKNFEAKKLLETVRDVPDLHPEIVLNAGITAYRCGDPLEGLRLFKVLLNLFPGSLYILKYAGLAAEAAGQRAEAEAYLGAAYARDPNDIVVQARLCRVLLRRGKFREAIRVLRNKQG